MKKNMSKLKSDATKSILCIEYQKLVALDMCMDAAENDFIYIECYGDVSSKTTSTEVKHHHGITYLSNHHIDFWKTLKNWVEEFSVFLSFSKLILHTTAVIKQDSIFNEWNDLLPKDKLKRIESIKPTDTIKGFHNTVFNFANGFNNDILLQILAKVEILHSQHKVKDYIELLKGKGMMRSVDSQWKNVVLNNLLGYITRQAINDSFIWKIDINDFDRNFRYLTRGFMKDDLPFPVVDKDAINVLNKGYKFVNEIRAINCSPYKVTRAIEDFLRANESVIRLIDATPMISENIKRFDDEIDDVIRDKKDSTITSIASDDLSEVKLMESSRALYDDCISHPLQVLRGVQSIEPYYQRGRVHNVVEETDFTWKIHKEEIYEA